MSGPSGRRRRRFEPRRWPSDLPHQVLRAGTRRIRRQTSAPIAETGFGFQRSPEPVAHAYSRPPQETRAQRVPNPRFAPTEKPRLPERVSAELFVAQQARAPRFRFARAAHRLGAPLPPPVRHRSTFRCPLTGEALPPELRRQPGRWSCAGWKRVRRTEPVNSAAMRTRPVLRAAKLT